MRLQTGVLLHFHRKQVGQGPGAIHVLGVNGEGLEMFDPANSPVRPSALAGCVACNSQVASSSSSLQAHDAVLFAVGGGKQILRRRSVAGGSCRVLANNAFLLLG